jgi:hypothetical protein
LSAGDSSVEPTSGGIVALEYPKRAYIGESVV